MVGWMFDVLVAAKKEPSTDVPCTLTRTSLARVSRTPVGQTRTFDIFIPASSPVQQFPFCPPRYLNTMTYFVGQWLIFRTLALRVGRETMAAFERTSDPTGANAGHRFTPGVLTQLESSKCGPGLFERIRGGHPAILSPLEDVVPPNRAIGKETVHSLLLVRKYLEHSVEFCRNHRVQMGGTKVQQFQRSIQAHDVRMTEHHLTKAVSINLRQAGEVEYDF
jgi:hypothetical protein